MTWEEKRAKSMEREFELKAYKAPMQMDPFEMNGEAGMMLKRVVT